MQYFLYVFSYYMLQAPDSSKPSKFHGQNEAIVKKQKNVRF